MSEKRLSQYDVQLVNTDDVRGGQLIESNVEPLTKRNRIEQKDQCKQSCTAYIAHLTKQVNAVNDLCRIIVTDFK